MTWFNTAEYSPQQPLANWPLGKHPVIAKGSSQQATKDNPNSGMLVLDLEIIDGPHKGFSGPLRLNIWSQPNNPHDQQAQQNAAKAREIAASQLSAIVWATLGGPVPLARDPKGAEFFGKPFVVEVTPQLNRQTKQPDERGYTQISAIFDINGNPPGRAGQQQGGAAGGFGGQQAQQFGQQQNPQGDGFGGGGGGQQFGQPSPQTAGGFTPQQGQQQFAQPQGQNAGFGGQQGQPAGGFGGQPQGQQQSPQGGQADWNSPGFDGQATNPASGQQFGQQQQSQAGGFGGAPAGATPPW